MDAESSCAQSPHVTSSPLSVLESVETPYLHTLSLPKSALHPVHSESRSISHESHPSDKSLHAYQPRNFPILLDQMSTNSIPENSEEPDDHMQKKKSPFAYERKPCLIQTLSLTDMASDSMASDVSLLPCIEPVELLDTKSHEQKTVEKDENHQDGLDTIAEDCEVTEVGSVHKVYHSSRLSQIDMEEMGDMEDILYEVSEDYSRTPTTETFIKGNEQQSSDIIIKSITSELNMSSSGQTVTNVNNDSLVHNLESNSVVLEHIVESVNSQ